MTGPENTSPVAFSAAELVRPVDIVQRDVK